MSCTLLYVANRLFCLKGDFLTTEDFADGLIVLTDGSLRLSSTQVDDEGVYSCVATNDAGRATKSIRLIVHGLYLVKN